MKKIIFSITCISTINALHAWEWSDIGNLFKKAPTEAVTKEYVLQPESSVFVTNDSGSITFKGWNQKKIMVETIKRGAKEQFANVHINITPGANQITIAPQFDKGVINFPIDFIVMVPKHCTQITAFIQKGPIKVKDCPAALELTAENGSIAVHSAAKTVTAKTNTGNIKVKQKTFTDNDTLFLETTKGDVLLKLAPKIHANIQAKTTQGTVSSSVYVTVEPQTTKLNKDYWARIKKEVTGSLGNGGAPITIDVTRGNISIEEL